MAQDMMFPGMNGALNHTLNNVVQNSINAHGEKNTQILKETNMQKELLDTLMEQTLDGHVSLLDATIAIPRNSGLYISYMRMDAIGPGERLQEGITPKGDWLTFGSITATCDQYGKTAYLSDVASSILNIDLWPEIRQQMKHSARQTLDIIARDGIHSQAGLRWTPSIIKYGIHSDQRMILDPDKPAANSISEITADHMIQYWDLYAIYQTMLYMHLITAGQRVRVALSEQGLNTLKQDPWFVSTLAANGDLELWKNNKFSTWGVFDFINLGSSGKMYYAGDYVTEMGGATPENQCKVDIETAIVAAQNCGTRLDLQSAHAGGNGVRYYSVGFISTKDDVIAQRAAVGYKFWMGIFLHTPPRVCIYYFATSPIGGRAMGSINKFDISILGEASTPTQDYDREQLEGDNAITPQQMIDKAKAEAKRVIMNQVLSATPDNFELGEVMNFETQKSLEASDLVWSFPMTSIIFTILVSGKGNLTGQKLVRGKINLFDYSRVHRANGWENVPPTKDNGGGENPNV